MTVAIGLGLMEFPFAGAGDYWRWVDLCEAGGVDSLWQTDRLVSRQPILECMAVMAALAGRTRRLRFGMNVVSLALRDPVLLAKQCATIDVLSEGRLLPGFGIGSPLGPEWEALDIDTRTRGRRTDESLQISPWLYRIATNTALDSLRRRKRITWVPFKIEMEPPAPQSDPAARHAERDAIQQALAQVPPDLRACLVLNMYQGLSYKEIADVLKISPNLVAVRIYRAREKFIEAYKRANPPSG